MAMALLVALWFAGVSVGGGVGVVHAATDETVTVRLDGRALFRVGASDELDASGRAQRIERRLQALLDRPDLIAPGVIEPGPGVGQATILVAATPVVTVTRADAEEELTTVEDLSARWLTVIDEALRQGMAARSSPVERFVTEVRVSVTTAFARLGDSAITIIPRLIAASMVLVFFWLLAVAVRRALRFLFRRIISDLTVENLLKQVAYYTVWLIGLILAADALGFTPETVIAGLGLTGLALGFALKDILSNFVSGLLILALRPFRIGDEIMVADAEGRVERIDLRATNIRTYDGRLVLVPNAELFTSRVTNNTASPVRRAAIAVTVDYGTDLRRVGEVVLDAAGRVAGVLADPPAAVRVHDLSIDGIVVEVRFWADSRRSDFVATASRVREAIAMALVKAGVRLADPGLLQLVTPRDRLDPDQTTGGDDADEVQLQR